MKIYIIFITIFLFFETVRLQNIQYEIENLLRSNIPENTNYSVSIIELSSYKTVYQKNPEIQLIPASTVKLYTTGISILMVGYDYNLTTKLTCDDLNITDGVIDGNIYLKGEGDPSFKSENLHKMILELKSKGIYKITKDIIIDDSFFDKILLRENWIEEEGSNVPLPCISPVTIDNNLASIEVIGNKPKSSPTIEIYPNTGYFTIVNRVNLGRKASITVSSTETNDGEKLIISGKIPNNKRIKLSIAIKNPSKFIGHLLRQFLLANDILFNGNILVGKSPKITNLIVKHEYPLIEVINIVNKRSNNFYAEHLFKFIGGKYSSIDGGAYETIQSIYSFLKANDLYENEMSIVDGSGISRYNKFSTNALTKFLAYFYTLKDEFLPFYNSLGIAGVDGTVRNRMKNTLAENNCRAKTGTLNGVVALAGYVTDRANKMYAFSINFNFSKKYPDFYRNLADKIVEIIANSN